MRILENINLSLPHTRLAPDPATIPGLHPRCPVLCPLLPEPSRGVMAMIGLRCGLGLGCVLATPTTRPYQAERSPLSLLSPVSPTGPSSSGAPQQVPTLSGPPNRTAPATSIKMGLRVGFFLNNSWQGKHPLGMPRVNFQLILSFKQRSTLQRLGDISAATLAPHGSLPYLLAGQVVATSQHWFVSQA
jgi:hypothetical protein